MGGYFFYGNEGMYGEYIRPFFHYLLTGWVITGFWYMPFILLVFITSPILVAFCKSTNKVQIIIMAVWFFIAMFIWRPVDNMNPLQCYFYFMPVFLLGCYTCINYHLLMHNYKIVLLISLISSIILMYYQVFIIGTTTNLEKYFMEYKGINVNIIERAFLTISIFVLFDRFFNYNIRLLDLIARSSFGIYLTHTIIIAIYTRLFSFKCDSIYFLILLTFVFTFICFLFNYAVKYRFGNNMRYVIG